MVRPERARARRRSSRPRRAAGSRPTVGSSRNSRSMSCMNSRATCTRRLCPIDRSSLRLPRMPARSKSSSSAADRSARSARRSPHIIPYFSSDCATVRVGS